jgi:hypothetical protein
MAEYTLTLAEDADMIVRFSIDRSGVASYAVVLRHIDLSTGNARTVRVFDNSHGEEQPQGGHHMHRYGLDGRKEPPEIFHHGSPSEAFLEARRSVMESFEAMIEEWRQ